MTEKQEDIIELLQKILHELKSQRFKFRSPIKTKKHYIECCVNDNFQVNSISYTEIKRVKKYDEYEMILDECYEIIAFAKNIKVVLGLEILVDNPVVDVPPPEP